VSSNDWWFAGFVFAALIIGWMVGYWSGRKDTNMRVAAHVDALYLVGEASALHDPNNQVPWPAIRACLSRMPHTYPHNPSALHRLAHTSHDTAEQVSGPTLPDDGPHSHHLPDSTQRYEEGDRP
jgi:hypothetical protein